MSEDITDAEAAVLSLGATRLPGGDGEVYADPVDHPFCLYWE